MSPIHFFLFLLAADLSSANRLYQEGHFKEAAAEYHQVLQENPSSVPAMLGMGRSLSAMHVYRQALSYLSHAQSLDPGNVDVQHAFGEALAASGYFVPAEKTLKQLTSEHPKDAESWLNLGALYYKNGYYGAALPALDKSLAEQPGNNQAAIYRAICLKNVGRGEEAEKLFGKLLENGANDRDPDLLLVYAQLLYETQRPKEALSRVDQALRATPDSPMAHFWKAKILFGTEQIKDAAKEAEDAIRLAPELPFAHAMLLNIYEALGRETDAALEADWLKVHEQRSAAGPER